MATVAALLCALYLVPAAGQADKSAHKDAAPKAAVQKGPASKSAAGKDAASKGPARALPVRAAPVRVAPAIDVANAVGSLRSDESVMIRPEIAGRIARIAFAEGRPVKKGDLLVSIDAAELRAALASSRAQAELDAQRLERAEDLFRKNFISQQALDEARSNRLRSVAKQSEDEAKLAKSTVRAPFSGVAGLRQVSEGAFVGAGTDVARLDKIDRLKVDFRVPELYLARLKAGQAVKVDVDAWPGERFAGAIYAIEPAVDESTRTVLVRASVDNTEVRLRPGMFARVQLQLGTRQEALWIPEQAIVPQGADSFVFRVADGKAERVKVRLGQRTVGEVEVLSGLAAGQQVVTEGTQKLRPGAAIAVMGAGVPAGRAPAGTARPSKPGSKDRPAG